MITVVVPTFRRPDGLLRAVRSVFAGTGAGEGGYAVIVVDNDPAGSAAQAMATLEGEAPEGVRFQGLAEPRPGVANARNRAMQAVETPLVAFLDDDQSAPPDWIARLLETHARFPAAATFGPVETALPDEVTRHVAYLQAFFARTHAAATGYTEASFGCGNCLLDRRLLPPLDPLFDTRMNETGGEDDMLFMAIRAAGGRFAWASEAKVFEHVPRGRATLSYTLRRAIAYGQGPCTEARRRNPPRYDLVAAWSAIGFAKVLWNGAAYAGQALLGRPGRAFALDRAARGFGKIVWWRNYKFYGGSAE